MWVIQNGVFGKETQKLIQVLDKLEKHYILVDFLDENCKLYDKKSILRGSVDFCLSRKNELINIENYTYTNYSFYFGNRMLNNDYIVLPWWKLYESKDLIYSIFNTDYIFIRPNSGKKIFTGTTLNKKWWNKELDIIKSLPSSNIRYNDLVIVSSHKNIISEYRLLMFKDKMIDYSNYEGPSIATEKLFTTFFSESIDFFPDTWYTLDLAVTSNSIKILEINNLFSSGWYDTDYEKIVQNISKEVNSV